MLVEIRENPEFHDLMRLDKADWPRCLLYIGRLLDGCRGAEPFELVNDGDLLLLIDRMLRRRGLDTVRISKVKGHADDGMVLHGQVCREDKLG